MSPRLSIYSLGALEVEVPNRSFAGLSGGKSSALLMVLAMRPECRYSREMLADMFWPSLPIQSARKNLRHTFFLLREALGDCGEQPFFLFGREWLSFNPRSNFWIDARELAAAEPRAMPAEVAKVERLAALCRGEFMAGFSLPDCPAFEDWLQGQRGDLRLRAVTLLEHLTHHHEEAGSYEKGLEFARRLLALDPSNEALHRRVLRLCGPSGQLPTEEVQHDACQTALGNGLGARPNNEETAALLRQRLEAKARADGRATAQEDASLLAPPTERRQVTVLYCELRFADIDDADEAAERLREPQQRCADIVRRHGGYVGQSHGGGLLAYFGYPDAREDAARRAVAVAQSLGEAAAPAVARCGVHTGLIATAPGLRVPDLVGKTSDLAIHLRIAVEEGTALSRETFRLVEGYVHCQPLGPRVLVTGDRPVEVYRVERPAVASQGPASAARLSPFVDREEEIGRLSATFRQVCAGKPAVVLVRGDPGIGKSRLIAEVQRRAVAEKDCALLESFCLPEHQGTPFFPFAGILQSSTPPAGPAATEQTQRRRLMNSMQEALLALSSQRPLLVLVEDLQWADSSSLDLLRMLGKRLESERVLILLTGRPEVDPSGWLPSDALVLELEHLPEEPSRQLANHWSAALPAEQVESIVAQADGVPLFIEEVARWKATHEGSDRAAPTIPATLQDLLMARIDQLGGARRLAQVGAACGRDFEPRLLAGVAQEEGLDVEGGIQGLLRSGLVLAVEERLQFKHALIQKAAYESQSRSLRRETHRRIACALQRDFPERCQSRPEALARHLTEAGEIAQAVGWWRAAGDAAARCWSYGEAVAHFNKALRLLADLPPSRERDRQELELALALGAQLIPATGFGSRETRECHARAYALCRGSDDRERLFRVIYGQWMGASSTYGLYFHAEELSGQLDRLAEMSGRGDFALAAHVARIATLYWMGRHAAVAPHVEAARAWFGRIDLDAYMQTIGLEPRVYALAFSGLSRWFLGHPDEAMATAREALAMAEESANVGARCFALSAAGLLERHLRQPDQVLERCAALSGLARTCAIPLWAAFAQSLRGWAQAARGEPEGRLLTSESLKEIREHCPGAEVAFGLLHLEALAALGAFEQLAAEADVLIDSAQRRHDGHVTPELHRLKGESLLAVSPENRGAAEACFREALELARAGGMQMLELRAAVSIYRMRQDAESRSSLAGVLARLDATSSHPDLLEARGLVECRAV